MRLTHCRLECVRRHRHLELSFAPGLTLISGANESGKSSLVTAMHRGLFLRASATGAAVQTLCSRLHAGHPLVEVGFEARGQSWTVQKRFSGSSGSVRLRSDGQPALLGSEAEETLATLLGVEEILGSRQANRILPSRWAHLWVMQGDAGQDLLGRGPEHYALDALIEQLEARAEGALQSPLDQRIHDELELLVQSSLSTRGVRQNSLLWQCQQDLSAARNTLEEARRQRQNFEDSSEELDRIVGDMKTIEREQLPALQRSRERLEQRRSLQQAIEPLTLKRERLERNRAALMQFDAEEQQQALERQQLDAGLEPMERALKQKHQQHEQTQVELEKLELQRQSLEQRGQSLRRREERQDLTAQLEELESKQRTRSSLQNQLQAVQEQLKQTISLSEEQLKALQAQEKQLEHLRIRQETMATRVKLLRAQESIRIDGSPLETGEERLLSEAFRLQVGEAVELEVIPGGGSDLKVLVEERTALERRQAQRLEALGVSSLAEAEQQWRRRTKLEAEYRFLGEQLQRQGAKDQQDPAEAIATLRDRLEALEEPMASQEEEPSASTTSPTHAQAALREALEQCRITYRKVQDSLRLAREQSRQQEQELRRSDQELQQRRLRRERLDAASEARRRQRAEVVEQSGELATLDPALEALRAQEQALRQRLIPLEQEEGLDGKELEYKDSLLRKRLQELSAQRGALQERCEALSLADPYGAEEEARTRLDQCTAREQQERQRVEAHRHLLSLFQQARSDLSSRYTEPLRLSINHFLTPLLRQTKPPEGRRGADGVQLGYDPKQGLEALGLERDGLAFAFEDLSGGMKEQLNAAMRLAIADVLRHGHDGCLPVLFDDAFTNSDPDRLQAVLSMLREAVERGLQVIVMSCDPDAYRPIADAVVELTDN